MHYWWKFIFYAKFTFRLLLRVFKLQNENENENENEKTKQMKTSNTFLFYPPKARRIKIIKCIKYYDYCKLYNNKYKKNV